MNKKVAILQSNYIPWKGYFDMINLVDEFILYDEMQYTKRDWRNRNLIKSANGTHWLSIPVKQSDKRFQRICDTEISEPNWGKKHWNSLVISYSKSPYFKAYRELFEPLYLNHNETLLSQINYQFITTINQILGIHTKISWCSDYPMAEGKSERLISLCQASGASEYLSGPAAKNYLDEQMFYDAQLKVTWMDYAGYRQYHQLYPPFVHGVSILDLIFNEGPEAAFYMNSFNAQTA